ncbi:cytochrome P450 [Rhexocercosporidium sp. MPI-PUGE-AT-0058]|nr:cytochrome P450 [Rhexocercosporidium sp. MPI-PUGE-AT-0058]
MSQRTKGYEKCILLLVGTCIYIIFSLLIKPLRSPLRHLPSPNQGSVWLRLLHEPRVPEIEKWMDTLPHCGLIRYHGIFNRERLFVASPKAAKDLLTTSAYKSIKPELQWLLANNIAGEGLLIQEGEAHKQARKRFNPIFSPARMKEWFPSLWHTTIEAIEALPQQTEETSLRLAGDSLDKPREGVTSILKLVSAASIDMIGHFGFNVNFNTLKSIGPQKREVAAASQDPTVKFGRAYIGMFKTTKRGQLTLEAASIIGAKLALKLPIPAVRTIDGIMGLVRQTAEHIVVGHKQALVSDEGGKLPKDDMLTSLTKTGHFSHGDLVEQTVHFLAAATETVAGSVCWAVHLLSRHPDVQAHLRDEVRENIPSPHDTTSEPVSDTQFRNLKYLNAVVQEVLRYHSINTLLWREFVEPATIAGVLIPTHTSIVFSPWALNRDPAHWGPDARCFVPERWLDDPSGGADHSYSFLTFGGGPRRCVGEQYARDELLCMIAGLIGRYEFTPIAPQMGTDEGQEIGDNFALTLFKIMEGWKLNVKEIPGW